jgi:hypothetical protein
MGRYRKSFEFQFNLVINQHSFTEGIDRDGARYEKIFWYPTHYRGTWTEAKAICDSFDKGFISLDSLDEAHHFLILFEHFNNLFDTYTHIGAAATVAKSLTDWYWVEGGEKLNFTLKFYPGTPDNYGGNELCMSLINTNGVYTFNDLKCYENYIYRFVCQTVKILPETPPTTVAPTTKYRELI